jgi:hypothetical protein
MGANIAGIYGAQIFRANDKPLYKNGFSIAISVLATGLSLAICRKIDEFFRRKRLRPAGLQAETTSSEHDSQGDGNMKRGAVLADEQPRSIG